MMELVDHDGIIVPLIYAPAALRPSDSYFLYMRGPAVGVTLGLLGKGTGPLTVVGCASPGQSTCWPLSLVQDEPVMKGTGVRNPAFGV